MTEKYKHAIDRIRDIEAGKTMQFCECGDDEWADDLNPGSTELDFLNDPEFYRTKPTPRKVPWGPEDVRPGMVFRSINIVFVPQGWTDVGVKFHHRETVIHYQWLQDSWEYSLDGITWAKCEKEEVVS